MDRAKSSPDTAFLRKLPLPLMVSPLRAFLPLSMSLSLAGESVALCLPFVVSESRSYCLPSRLQIKQLGPNNHRDKEKSQVRKDSSC